MRTLLRPRTDDCLRRVVLHVAAHRVSRASEGCDGSGGEGIGLTTFAKQAVVHISHATWDSIPFFRAWSASANASASPFLLSVTVGATAEVDALLEVISRCA